MFKKSKLSTNEIRENMPTDEPKIPIELIDYDNSYQFTENAVIIDPYFRDIKTMPHDKILRYNTPFIAMNLTIGEAAIEYSKLKEIQEYRTDMADCDIDKHFDMIKDAFISSICSRYDFFVNSLIMQIENEIALYMKNSIRVIYRPLRDTSYNRLSPNSYAYQIRDALNSICRYPKDMRDQYYTTLRLMFRNILLTRSMNDIFTLVSGNINNSFHFYHDPEIQYIYQECINKLTSMIYGSHDSAFYEMDSIMSTIIMNDDCFLYKLDRCGEKWNYEDYLIK